MARAIQLVEVGARDGLQNEPDLVATEDKTALITQMIDAGARRLEVASFVNPKRVPQMADGEAVIESLPDRSDVSYIGLVLNKRGVLRALETRAGGKRGVDEAGCVIVASNTFGMKNQGQTIEDGIRENREMLRLAKSEGLIPQITISAAFGCPFEGPVAPETVIDVARQVAEEDPVEIALADTIGVGVPNQVTDLFGRLREVVPGVRLRAHFHNTRGTGIANALAAVDAGVDVLDASVGGLGGCPFAPKATGNIATEDLIYALDHSDVETGVTLQGVIDTATFMSDTLGRQLSGLVSRAGDWPTQEAAS